MILSSTSLLDALKKATAQTEQTESFDFLGMPVTLRVLKKTEEDDVAEEMVAFHRDDEEAKNAHYLYEFCSRTLSRAIHSLAGESLQGVEFIEHEGQKYEKRIFLTDFFLKNLNSADFALLWSKYNTLMQRVEEDAKKRVSFDASDERLDDTLDRLLDEAAQAAKKVPSDLVTRLLVKHGFKQDDPKEVVPEASTEDVSKQEDPEPSKPLNQAGSIRMVPVEPTVEQNQALLNDEVAYLQRAKPSATVAVDEPPKVGINPRFRPRG